MVWASLTPAQSDSTGVPEWFGRRWRLPRAILQESQSGLGVAGASPDRFYASPRVVRAVLASENKPLAFSLV